MAEKPYKAKSITGAQAYVRSLQKQLKHTSKLLERYAIERRYMAMLAADGPAFDNPIKIYQAKKIRDEILRIECRLQPDGRPLP